jgi:pilus assembly protein CpaB
VDTTSVTTVGSTKKDLLNRVELPMAVQPSEVSTQVKTVLRKVPVRKAVVKKAVYEQVEVVRGANKTVEEFRPSSN